MEKQEIGKLGENIACRFLVKQGFEIIERNFWRKYGEIDIVAHKGQITHFVEVKTVSRENVNHETLDRPKGGHRPEDNIHFHKVGRLKRVIQVYLINRQIKWNWQFDVITVLYDARRGEAKVEFLENLIL